MPVTDTLAQKLARATSRDGLMESPAVAAASMRGPVRNELLVIPVVASSVLYNVPNGTDVPAAPDWRGKFINAYAEGADVYIQFSSSTDASVDEAISSTVSAGVGGRNQLAPAGNECWIIPRGQWLPIPVPANAQTFAIKGSTTGKLRTHLAEQ